jgi:cobaltochelatase CobN
MGSAAGLDGPESAVRILRRLQDEGYTLDHVPADGKALISEMLEGVTNNLDWTTSENVSKNSPRLIGKKEYLEWYSGVPEFIREKMEEKWGPPPGEIMVDNGKIIIPGVVNGNVLITVQPMRSWMEQCDCMIHDPELVMPHQYLAFYRWLKEGFGAQAVIHLGTHGTLEWLPGKGNVLSSKCCPDIVLNGIPNIYPFQMDDPGEGLQAKRRSEAVLVGYTCMPMVRADSYGDASILEGLIQEYLKNRLTISSERTKYIVDKVRELSSSLSYSADLNWDDDTSDEIILRDLPELNDRLQEAGNELIRDGLHILGRVPAGSMRDDYVNSFTRMKFGGRRSLPDEIMASGFEGDAMSEARDIITEFGSVRYEFQDC